MFERHAGGERVILVALDFGTPDFAESVAELRLLAAGAGLDILGEVQGKRSRPDAALFVGSGKADEIAALVAATEADVVIFDHELSPAQERNLERRVHCRVIDRTEPDPRHLRARARTAPRASCRSSWPSSSICAPAWCAAGPTSSASAAASACAAPARRSSKPTAA